MDLHERRLFEATLSIAIERFRDRVVQRNEGVENALRSLQTNPEGDGTWLAGFVDQFFADELLDNAAGAAYVLQALERRKIAEAPGGTIGEVLQRLARSAFAELLRAKTIESLEGGVAFGS
jgi:hypothetical protein